MSKVEEAIRSTVARIVRKEMRETVVPLSRDVREMKRTVSSLARSVAALEKAAEAQAREAQAELMRLDAPEAEVQAARFSPNLIRKLRARLGITQAQLAALVGVSTGAVTSWERGDTSPRGGNRVALVALRKLGRRDAKRLVAEKSAAAPVDKPAKRKAPRRKRRTRARSRKK
ncbi:MAG: helix-turn-helix domain-containing protein [Armatimonadota bacterium]|nr:MAG: helix-turn-helix domain-containing protein [Armatimonadota bacterium]